MKKAVIGIARSRVQAETIVDHLMRNGFAAHDISVLLPDKQGTRDFAHEHNTKAPEGAVAGAGTGGVLGGTLGLLAGIGTLAIPGAGPFIAAGPLLAALSGAAAGAAAGGVIGALIGMGIPELEAKVYAGKLSGGNVLVAVHVENADQQKTAIEALKAAGAERVDTTAESAVPKDGRPSSIR
jgi:hypothetical protein